MGGVGWGQVEDAESITAARAAFDLGINFFDTADMYGDGHSERVLGKAIAGFRDDVVIATKAGRRYTPEGKPVTDGRPEWLKQAIDHSLKRLGTDHVDLYQLHWPDPEVPIEDSVGALRQIRDAGKARHIGVCNCNIGQLAAAQKACRIVSNQVPVNMLYREYLGEALPYCHGRGIGVMGYGTLAQGLLTGKFGPHSRFAADDVRANSPLFAQDRFGANLELVEGLRPIARRLGRSLAQVAVSWALSNVGLTSAICGAKRPSQIQDAAGGLGWALSDDDLARIGELLPPSCPSPRPLS